ncbi:MAG: hypothetical protein KGJ57_20315 [Sphingomonadales bacterium]|nr:hypothetical protein [Sphingomonadales bacterium]
MIALQPFNAQCATLANSVTTQGPEGTGTTVTPETCGDNAVRHSVKQRLDAWLVEFLPSKTVGDMQRVYYKSQVDDAMPDPNPPSVASGQVADQIVHCTLRFSANVYSEHKFPPGTDPLEIKTVPYTLSPASSGPAVTMDLPPANFQIAQLSPGQKRLIGSFYYRGMQLVPALGVQPTATNAQPQQGAAKPTFTTLGPTKKPVKPAPRPHDAIEGYNAMFSAAAAERDEIMRANGLGAYVDKAKRPLTPAQRANLQRKVRACENAGGTWGLPIQSGSFLSSGPEGCYFMQLQR